MGVCGCMPACVGVCLCVWVCVLVDFILEKSTLWSFAHSQKVVGLIPSFCRCVLLVCCPCVCEVCSGSKVEQVLVHAFVLDSVFMSTNRRIFGNLSLESAQEVLLQHIDRLSQIRAEFHEPINVCDSSGPAGIYHRPI